MHINISIVIMQVTVSVVAIYVTVSSNKFIFKRVIQCFCFPDRPKKVGTSWISRKGESKKSPPPASRTIGNKNLLRGVY